MGKKTYGQVWPAYNAAQVNEKDWFLRLLFALCLGMAEPEQPRGRTRLPLRDILFVWRIGFIRLFLVVVS
jgi:hypothetical protein